MNFLSYVVVTIFKPDGAKGDLTPLRVIAEPIHPPAADDSPSDEAVPIAELSVGSSTGPLPESSKADVPELPSRPSLRLPRSQLQNRPLLLP